MMYNDFDVYGIIARASNIRNKQNPEYTKEDFFKFYPQFTKKKFITITTDEGEEIKEEFIIPDVVIEAYVKLAHASINYGRYHELWEICMGLFIAHFLTLYLQTMADPDSSVKSIISKGLASGLPTSKSAGDLSISYDFSTITNDFNGWGTYKLTEFGQQLITFAKVVSKGGMVVW